MDDFTRRYRIMVEHLSRKLTEPGYDDQAAAEEQLFLVDWTPAILSYDLARIDPSLAQVPPELLRRLRLQPFWAAIALVADDARRSPLIPAWQRNRFKEFGYAFTFLPVQHIFTLPRGRHWLDRSEVVLRAPLAVWTSAALPVIARLVDCFAFHGPEYASEHDWLAAGAWALVALADSDLVETLDRLADEGRKHRLALHPEGSLHGRELQVAFQFRAARRLVSADPADAREMQETLTAILDSLALGLRLGGPHANQIHRTAHDLPSRDPCRA